MVDLQRRMKLKQRSRVVRSIRTASLVVEYLQRWNGHPQFSFADIQEMPGGVEAVIRRKSKTWHVNYMDADEDARELFRVVAEDLRTLLSQNAYFDVIDGRMKVIACGAMDAPRAQ